MLNGQSMYVEKKWADEINYMTFLKFSCLTSEEYKEEEEKHRNAPIEKI